MTEGQLETAKSLRTALSSVEQLFDLFHHGTSSIGCALCIVYNNDKTFKETFNQLIKETKERLQKEFDEL